MPVLARYNDGTQRLVSPAETLERIAPHLAANGVTRSMPVTRLDSLGVPTYCAIRPDGLLLQVSNGKGTSEVAARVSAVMEAIELTHAERPVPSRLRRTSLAALAAAGEAVLAPGDIHGFRNTYFTPRFACHWTAGENLVDGAHIWAPASAVYFFCAPCLHDTSTNGLASGNHLAEATLHALYELIERDAMTRLSVNGVMRIRERAIVIDPETIDDARVRGLVNQIESAGTKVSLLALPGAIPIHTFWAVTVNRHPLASVSTLNVGWGTHVDLGIAALRALTEAAQSRLSLIHGAREDIPAKPVFQAEDTAGSAAVRYFLALEPSAAWDDVHDMGTVPFHDDLEVLLDRVVAELARNGHDRLIRFDLTNPALGDIPVVKVVAPSLLFNHKLF